MQLVASEWMDIWASWVCLDRWENYADPFPQKLFKDLSKLFPNPRSRRSLGQGAQSRGRQPVGRQGSELLVRKSPLNTRPRGRGRRRCTRRSGHEGKPVGTMTMTDCEVTQQVCAALVTVWGGGV